MKNTVALLIVLFASFSASATEIAAKWFRLTIKEKYKNPSNAANLRMAELQFYDINGVSQGVGLKAVEPCADASEMAEGTCFLSTPYTVSRGAEYLFDGKYSGNSVESMSITGIPVGDNRYAAMSVNDPSTWSVVVVRLPESANPVASYLPYVGYYNWSGKELSASRWTLEASYDGRRWFTVHDQSGTDAVAPASNNSPYNGGISYALAPSEILEFTVDSGVTKLSRPGFYNAYSRIMKTGGETAVAIGACAGAAVKVSEGTLSLGAAFTHYRFKVDSVRGKEQNMEISEFTLLCKGKDVTQGYSSVSSCSTDDGGGGSPAGEGPEKAVDGNLNTKFLDRSTKTASTADNCYLELVYPEPVAVDGCNWASGPNNYWSGNDSRVPTAWRLQGSDDGEMWFDLIVGGENFTPTYKASTWQSESGFEYGATSLGGVASVDEGAVLAVAGDVELADVVNNGTVSLARNANAVFAPDEGEICTVSGGGITGPGGIVKRGVGVLEMNGGNSYAGDTKVESGVLRIGRGAAVSAKWFRLVVKQKYSLKSNASLLRLAEWALYDSDGVQRNLSLAVCPGALADRRMPPGSCKITCPYTVANTNLLFNGSYAEGTVIKDLYISGLPLDGSGYCAMSVNDPSTWVTVTLRLAEDAAPISGYNLFVGYYNWNGTECSPSRWTLEASADGENWFTVDDRIAADVASPGDNEVGYNGGEPFAFVASEGAQGAAIPAESVVEVAAGARLEIVNAAWSVSRLRIDCSAGAGTISGFNPADSGELYLNNAAQLTSRWTALPIILESPLNVSNLKSWAVFADGEKVERADFRVDSSGLAKVRLRPGVQIIFR